MQIAFNEKTKVVMLRNVGDNYARLKAMGMVWDKQSRTLRRNAGLEFLNELAQLIKLPDCVEDERRRLERIAAAIAAERAKEDPVPYITPPVKPQFKPYRHQIKAYNMALITFGLIDPSEVM